MKYLVKPILAIGGNSLGATFFNFIYPNKTGLSKQLFPGGAMVWDASLYPLGPLTRGNKQENTQKTNLPLGFDPDNLQSSVFEMSII